VTTRDGVSARPPAAPFADDLAALLEREPLGLSCRELRRRLERRLSDVRSALESDRRFAHSGRGRGSRWRLAAGDCVSASWVRLGSQDLPWSDLDASGVPVLARGPQDAP
jgi:hypothetical protein